MRPAPPMNTRACAPGTHIIQPSAKLIGYAAAMRTCGSCGAGTPEGNFCVRCGAPLGEAFGGHSRGRSHFAAAPHEHVALPMVISSLFPHLPRSSHLFFRL